MKKYDLPEKVGTVSEGIISLLALVCFGITYYSFLSHTFEVAPFSWGITLVSFVLFLFGWAVVARLIGFFVKANVMALSGLLIVFSSVFKSKTT